LLREAHIPGTEDAMTTANGQHDHAAEAFRLVEAEQARIAENIRRVRDAVELDLYGQLGYTDPDDLRAGFGDGFGFGGTLPPYRKQSDKRGEQVAVYVDENQLQRIRDRSRKLCAENEFAICAVENRKSYLVGKGLTYTAGPRPDTDCPPLLVKQTQAVLDAFGELNDMGDLEQELVGRCDRDGEAFIRLFPGEDALLELRWVEPEHVRAPSGEGWGPELSFGIETPPRDVETERAFWIVEQPLESQQPARVPGEQVIHVKWNVDRNAKRGVPTFYPIDQNLRWAEELLASMAALAKTRAKIAALRKVSGASKQFVENLLASLTDAKATDATTGAAISMEKLRFGSIITHNQNVEWAFPNAEIAASDFVAVLQAVLRSAAARVVMPEWMFTADACLSEDSELLTDRGWVGVNGLRPDDRVGTMNPGTGELEYQQPVRHYCSYRRGLMVHVKNSRFDLLVTPNHDVYMSKMLARREDWQKVRAWDMVNWPHVAFKCLSSVRWAGGATPETLSIPGLGETPAALALRFLGIYLGDGSVTADRPRVCVGGISKARKVEAYGPVFAALGFKHTFDSAGRHHWYLDNQNLRDWLAENVGTECQNKRLPALVWSLNVYGLAEVWAGLLESDGHRPKRGTETVVYSTTSPGLADDVQILALRLGMRASISKCPPGQLGTLPVYKVSVGPGKVQTLRRCDVHVVEHYEGHVWCVEVPNGLIVSRRNGKVAVSGNSNNNMASALIAGDPAARNFERLQHAIKRKLGEGRHRRRRSLVWRQLAYSVRRGVLPQAVFDLVDVQVEAPTLVIRDKKEEADTNAVYFDMKAKSRKTIQQEQSLDPDQEDANFEEDSQTEWLQPKAPAVPGQQMPGAAGEGKQGGEGGDTRRAGDANG
jgi:hypothetical protein